MQHRNTLRAAALGALALVLAPALAAPGDRTRSVAERGLTAVPPATYAAPPEAKKTDQRPLIAVPGRTIRLPVPSSAEIAAAKAGKLGMLKHNTRSVGFARDVAAAEARAQGADLQWVAVAGGRAARIDIQSPGAAAVRVELSMAATDPGVTVRFAGSAAPADVLGPYAANEIAKTTAAHGSFWSPVLEGDTASIEVFVPANVDVHAVTLRVVRVSHLIAGGTDLQTMKASTGIGASDTCEMDVACVSNPTQALRDTAKGVAKMLFTESDGTTYLCTGTLLNDSSASFTPYFYTANHCVGSEYAASTLNTYWFFDAASCGSKSVPAYVRRTGGATLLGRSEDADWSLLRLNEAPPTGAQFSAWRADPLNAGDAANVMHHPEGDLKKWSQGFSGGYATLDNGSSYAQMQWLKGSTEPGSSGAGLFTLASPGGYYELRGGLWGGTAACGNPSGSDYFSRLDRALPLLRQYLTPNVANPNGEAVAVEFYNKQLDHYFISTNAAEIEDLDTGVHPGWERTGLRFLAYSDPAQAPASATPVCRFYMQTRQGRFALLLRRSEGMRGYGGAVRRLLDIREPERVLHRAPGQGDRRVSGRLHARLSLLQHPHDESSLHHGSRRARRACGNERVDRGGLRAAVGHHVCAADVIDRSDGNEKGGHRAALFIAAGARVSAGLACTPRRRASGYRTCARQSWP